MPKHPITGEEVSNPVYEAVVAEIERSKQREEQAKIDAQEELLREIEQSESELEPLRQADFTPLAQVSSTNSFMPFAVLFMFVCVMSLGGYIAYKLANPTVVTPPPVNVVVPVANLDSLVAPIKAKLEYDPAKALKVYKAYAGLSEAIAGKSGKRLKDTRDFAAAHSALLQDIDAGSTNPIGREIDEAIAVHIGVDWGSDDGEAAGWSFKAFEDADRAKLAEVTKAISGAAESTL